jgi:uracil phosphoribosyltransferase
MLNNVHEIGKGNSVFNRFISEIRSEEIQQDSMRFRRNLERIGEIMAYEISKKLEYEERSVISPLGEAIMHLPKGEPVLATILRAGLPLHLGMLNYFDRAESAFVSAYRKHHKGGRFEIEVEYASCPNLEGKTLIITDPMLATGSSMVLVANALRRFGNPAKLHLVSAIASKQGVEYVKQKLPAETEIWIGAIDAELTAQAYIVPGLGDAGDLAYGVKEH